ncbi:hypothetical protein Taro_040295 [Colocasia esculenta]|uniref:Uncharacterized protein n=1 Tax=Colocasia esculenta TaxID=4460 RepID=A0A843WBH5_COLES|nr:hypothetical protein [Colocasia esculenta]
MRGAGGPLLCIGDLLHDLADDDAGAADHQGSPSSVSPSMLSPSPPSSTAGGAVPRGDAPPLRPSDLHDQFQETYTQLTESLMGTDHSWTALTLKLCSAVETADKLVNFANSNVELLLKKVHVLESIIKRSDAAIQIAKAIEDTKIKEETRRDS